MSRLLLKLTSPTAFSTYLVVLTQIATGVYLASGLEPPPFFTLREHLTEYRNVTKRSLALQQQAVTRQEEIGKLYRRVVMAAVILVPIIIILLIYLMARLR